MARKNRYDAPRRSALGQPPPDDATEVTVRTGRGLLPVDDETNFGDSSRGSELEAELLKLDPRALAKRLAASASSDVRETTVRRPAVRRAVAEMPEDQPTTIGPVPNMTMEPSASSSPLPIESPAALARRLAAEAMARLERPAPTSKPQTSSKAPTPRRPAPPAERAVSKAPQRRAKSRPTPRPAPPRRTVKRQPSEPPTQPASKQPDTQASPDVAADTHRPAPKREERRRRRSLVSAEPAPPRKRRAPRTPTEDPAALAHRLAEEAKARLSIASPPTKPSAASEAATSITNVAAVVRTAQTAPVATPKSAAPPPAPKPEAATATAPLPPDASLEQPPRPKSRLADRAPRIHKKRSAADAVKHLSVEPAPLRAAAPPIGPATSSAPVAATPLSAPLAALTRVFPGAIIESEHRVEQVTVFKALWEAHQARAVRSGRLPLAASATVLLAHVDAGRPLMAARIHFANQSWAAFCAGDTGALLAVVDTPEIYLAGIK